MVDLEWVAVVPVKALATAKSRLDPASRTRRQALARAFAVDTVGAVTGATSVRAVVVVCNDPEMAAALAGPHVTVLDESVPAGLNHAARAGLGWVALHHRDAGVLVVQADLPALRSRDVDAILRRASALTRAAVPDREGTGTTMLTGWPDSPPRPRFGVGSLARHLADGAVLLDAAHIGSGIARAMRDVDTAEHLAQAQLLGVGPATGRVLELDAG